GSTSPISAFTPLLGGQVDLPAGGRVELEVDPTFEHGLLVDAGAPRLDRTTISDDRLAYIPPGRSRLTIEAADAPVRAILLGGEPLGEALIMWWNFIGRTHEEIVAFRDEWQGDVTGGARPDGRFGAVVGYPGPALPAPEMPTVKLRPRSIPKPGTPSEPNPAS